METGPKTTHPVGPMRLVTNLMCPSGTRELVPWQGTREFGLVKNAWSGERPQATALRCAGAQNPPGKSATLSPQLSLCWHIKNLVRNKSNFAKHINTVTAFKSLGAKIYRFRFSGNRALLPSFRAGEGRIAIVTKRGAECGGRVGAE